jgi:hypothetical protein
VNHIRFRKRTFKVLRLVGHVNHLKNVLTHISTPIILGLHQFAHEDADVSFRGTLEMFFNFSHESLGIVSSLRKSSSNSRIDDIVHNHECNLVRSLPLGLSFLILSLLKRNGSVISTLSNGLNRLILTEGVVLIHDGQNHLNVGLSLSKVHPPSFVTPFM